MLEPYAILPWWACCQIGKVGRLPWCAKAVLSVVLARLMSLKAAVEREDAHGMDPDDVIGSIVNMGDDDRFRFSLGWLMAQTGLSHDSVTTAKRLLNHRYGIVAWQGTPRPKGRFKAGVMPEADILAPDWRFRVVVESVGEGKCHIDFGHAKG